MKKRLPTVLLIFVFVAGLGLLLYPTVSDWWNTLHQTVAISEYTEIAANLDTETYKNLLSEAQHYNEELFRRGGNKFILSKEEHAAYNNVLRISKTGIMGYISIPSVKVKLPIYHGTSEAVLSSGIGHLEGTSFPIGGINTHCVLSGHRGLPSAKLFTNLDKVKEGDLFTLNVLDEVLTYEVDQIRIVLPQELSDLFTVVGKDYCTLVTCTPYGINSHRLLVRGHRVSNNPNGSNVHVIADAVPIEPVVVAPIAAVPMLAILLIGFIFKTRSSRRIKIIKIYTKSKLELNKAPAVPVNQKKKKAQKKVPRKKSKDKS